MKRQVGIYHVLGRRNGPANALWHVGIWHMRKSGKKKKRTLKRRQERGKWCVMRLERSGELALEEPCGSFLEVTFSILRLKVSH